MIRGRSELTSSLVGIVWHLNPAAAEFLAADILLLQVVQHFYRSREIAAVLLQLLSALIQHLLLHMLAGSLAVVFQW